MENDKLVENPVNVAERPSSRLYASAESENNGSIDHSRDSIVSRFERVAAANPNKVAVVCGDASQTYEALNSQANQVARHLRGLGV